ncbi:MAG: RNA polymerase sigma factor RpoD/SigA [Planctomycetes bacterium]|nr:RNA polymerase sigma factor RpoD/SigA [Planctomycetota bacterium]
MEARNQMARCNLRLVVSIAKNYNHRGMPLLDLIEEGNLGLLKAVVRFSPDQGCKFSTYASWWIKQTIRRALINKVKSVRVPAYMVEIITRWKRKSAELAQKLGREPSAEEIGAALELSASKIKAIRQALNAAGSTSRGTDPDSNVDIEDVLSSVPEREGAGGLGDYDREALNHALEFSLTDRERKIIELRYGLGEEEPLTLETIGERIGLTRERVRQIENQALHKLEVFMIQKDERDERERQERRRQRKEAERAGVPFRPTSSALLAAVQISAPKEPSARKSGSAKAVDAQAPRASGANKEAVPAAEPPPPAAPAAPAAPAQEAAPERAGQAEAPGMAKKARAPKRPAAKAARATKRSPAPKKTRKRG